MTSERQARGNGVVGEQRFTIVGVRLTIGNAVECPQVRAEDGEIYNVSYLAPTIAVGDRIRITGFWAITTTCVGRVMYAEEVHPLGDRN